MNLSAMRIIINYDHYAISMGSTQSFREHIQIVFHFIYSALVASPMRNKQLALSSSKIMRRVKVTYEAFRGHTFCELTGFTWFDRTVDFGFFVFVFGHANRTWQIDIFGVTYRCECRMRNQCVPIGGEKNLFASCFANFSNSLCFSMSLIYLLFDAQSTDDDLRDSVLHTFQKMMKNYSDRDIEQ